MCCPAQLLQFGIRMYPVLGGNGSVCSTLPVGVPLRDLGGCRAMVGMLLGSRGTCYGMHPVRSATPRVFLSAGGLGEEVYHWSVL